MHHTRNSIDWITKIDTRINIKMGWDFMKNERGALNRNKITFLCVHVVYMLRGCEFAKKTCFELKNKRNKGIQRFRSS